MSNPLERIGRSSLPQRTGPGQSSYDRRGATSRSLTKPTTYGSSGLLSPAGNSSNFNPLNTGNQIPKHYSGSFNDGSCGNTAGGLSQPEYSTTTLTFHDGPPASVASRSIGYDVSSARSGSTADVPRLVEDTGDLPSRGNHYVSQYYKMIKPAGTKERSTSIDIELARWKARHVITLQLLEDKDHASSDIQYFRSAPSEWQKLRSIGFMDAILQPFTADCALEYVNVYFKACEILASYGHKGEGLKRSARASVSDLLSNCPEDLEQLLLTDGEENRILLRAISNHGDVKKSATW